MPIHAEDVETLHRYADGVMSRAAHHARNVRAIALTLLGGIIWRAAPDSIKIKPYGGHLANMLWWKSASTGKKYAFAYNHESQEIEIRDQKTNGDVLHRFSNETPVTVVEQIFSKL